MKRTFIFIQLWLLATTLQAATYYIHPETGDENNSGVNAKYAWRSLTKVNGISLHPGDTILLASGQYFNEPLVLDDIHGTSIKPIVISTYTLDGSQEDSMAFILVEGYANGVYLLNCSGITISNLSISATAGVCVQKSLKGGMRCGLLIETSKAGEYGNFKLRNLHIENVFYEKENFIRSKKEVRTANGTQAYGWGIRIINRTLGALLRNVSIEKCHIENVSHTGLKFTGRNNSIRNIAVYNCDVIETGGPGIQMSGVYEGHVSNNYIDKSGSNNDSRKWGRGSGLWTWGSSDILIEKNYFLNANGPGDSAGAHIDFNCNNVVLQYNYSANNAGGFCEILGNTYNCAYRYNISVNDGFRVKGEDGAFQEGKTLWLSGYAGKNNKRIGPFNSYIYNNTIYVAREVVSKIAIDRAAMGIAIVNNIFYIEGEAKGVLGDQYLPELEGTTLNRNVLFKNNLFLHRKSWPKNSLISDELPTFGDPAFENVTGLRMEDFVPTSKKLVQDKGIVIPRIFEDKLGLIVGLKVKHDIMGNQIIGLPDMGAIEMISK